MARRQLRRSSRQSLETLPSWTRPSSDPRFGPPPRDPHFGLPPPPSYRPPYPVTVPPPTPPPATVDAQEPPKSTPANNAEGQQFERLAASAAALIDELLDHAGAPPEAPRPPLPAPPPSPEPVLIPLTTPGDLATAPAEPVSAAPAVETPARAPLPPTPELVNPPTQAAPPQVADPDEHPGSDGEFPPCPTWPYTRQVRMRQRRRRRRIN